MESKFVVQDGKIIKFIKKWVEDPTYIIDTYAFYKNKLTNIQIPDSVTHIGNCAFYGNNLTNIQIPDSVTYISNCVFYGNNLTNIRISDSVRYIGLSAFYGNKLTSIVIPEKFKTKAQIRNIFGFTLNELHHRNRKFIRPCLIGILPFHIGLSDIIVDYIVPCNNLVLECM